MTHLSSEFAGRIRGSIKQWLHSRIHECHHCCQCEAAVTPWDTYCPICGQKDPARHSASAALQLVLGFMLLAMIIWFLISAI